MADEPPQAAGAKSGGRSPIILVMAVCAGIMAGSAGGIFYMFKKMQAGGPAAGAAQAAPQAEEAHAPEEPPKGEEGEGEEPSMITLAPFVVNLEDETGETHFLKMTVAVELAGGKWHKYFEHQTPKVRNAIVLLLSNIKISQTQGQANRRKLVDDLHAAVVEATSKHAIKEIFLTEFVVQ